MSAAAPGALTTTAAGMAASVLIAPLLIAVSLIASGVFAAAPAEAAVRVCQAARSSGIVTGPTESEGKKRAIAGWMEKVRPLGPRYMGWGTATRRILKCVHNKSQGFDCIAVATPCTVEQVPGVPGQPRPPQGRRRPGDPGRPIEI